MPCVLVFVIIFFFFVLACVLYMIIPLEWPFLSLLQLATNSRHPSAKDTCQEAFPNLPSFHLFSFYGIIELCFWVTLKYFILLLTTTL